MYDVKAEYLSLNNQFVGSSLWKDTSPPSDDFLQLLIFLYTVLRTLWPPCWWEFMGIASDIFRRCNLTAHSMIFWLLRPFCPLFSSVPWGLGMEIVCRYTLCRGFHTSGFYVSCNLCESNRLFLLLLLYQL